MSDEPHTDPDVEAHALPITRLLGIEARAARERDDAKVAAGTSAETTAPSPAVRSRAGR